ncbi:hypothetical protein HNQ56_000085 [Anaerotaenia torta]|uniref:hypothetical protein n=1 Tax=Anaerotaenia torta TaxID=433293 RepID=UPI003D1F9932
MKRLFSRIFTVLLLSVFVLSNLSFTSFASEETEEEYLAPYIALLEQYAGEAGADARVGNIDSFYETCKRVSLSEWENNLEEIFKGFQSVLEYEEPIVLERDNDTQLTPYPGEFDGGVPGVSAAVSSAVSYNSSNKGVPGVSSNDKSSEYRYLEASSSSGRKDDNTKSFSSGDSFSDTFTGYIGSGYKCKTTVDGTLLSGGTPDVFNNVNWQAWDFPGESYFHIRLFKDTIIHGDTASTEAAGDLVTAEGLILTVQVTVSYKINASTYHD